MASLSLPAEGGCRCGSLRFRVTRMPVMTSICHCTGCQRMSGSAFSTTAMVPTEGFEILSGDPVVGGIKGPRVSHMHCPDCMSWVYSSFGPEMPTLNVRAVMFDDSSWFVPFVESWTDEKLDWVQLGLAHSFPGFPQPEARAALMAEFAETLKES